MRTPLRIALCLFGALSVASLLAAETLSYPDLVRRLPDLEHLATLPVPGERCAQCSSYDRSSVYDAAAGKYVRWDANGDGGGIIRQEGDLSLLAEEVLPQQAPHPVRRRGVRLVPVK